MKQTATNLLTLIIIVLLVSCNSSKEPSISSNWRGPDRDGKYPEKNLLKEWPESGPEVLWSFEGLGEGHTSVTIDEDKLYVTGMTDSTGNLFQFNLNGELLWKKTYGLEWNKNWPGPRSTPVIHGDKLLILSGRGKIQCLDKNTAEVFWSRDLMEENLGKQIVWGITENLVIIEDKLIISAGGETDNVIALDVNSGEKIWSCKANGEQSAYGSPILIKLDTRTLYVNHVGQHLIAVDTDSGEFLWKVPQDNKHIIHPNPPIYKDGYILSHSGRFGSQKLKLAEDGSSVELVWKNDSLDNFMGGTILLDGYLYAASQTKDMWRGVNWETGEEISQTKEIEGDGVIIYADGMLYCYSDKGTLALAKPDMGKIEVISKTRITKGTAQHWAHPVIEDGVLYLRHGDALMAFNIKAS